MLRNREEEEWGSQQKKIASFTTVEEFWGVYNRILPVSKLQSNCNYHFFKVWIAMVNVRNRMVFNLLGKIMKIVLVVIGYGINLNG